MLRVDGENAFLHVGDTRRNVPGLVPARRLRPAGGKELQEKEGEQQSGGGDRPSRRGHGQIVACEARSTAREAAALLSEHLFSATDHRALTLRLPILHQYLLGGDFMKKGYWVVAYRSI